jgi:uroporphyrinogen-III synthase
MASVLVIRRNDRFSELLREAGFRVENLELITTRPKGDLSDLQLRLERLDEYDGLFFTSPAAAEVFVEHSKPSLFRGKIYVLGERSRKVFEENGFKVTFKDEANTAEELISSFDRSEFDGNSLLFVRGDRSVRTIPELLNGTATVEEVIVYETVAVPPENEQLENVRKQIESNSLDWVCFFSPSGVEEFGTVFENLALSKLKAAAIGDTTAGRARSFGLNVDFISERSGADGFARGLIAHITKV